MPTAPEYAFKEKSTKLLIFHPSEPFTFGHFNVRHPVFPVPKITLCEDPVYSDAN